MHALRGRSVKCVEVLSLSFAARKPSICRSDGTVSRGRGVASGSSSFTSNTDVRGWRSATTPFS
jgi:hypothetical protein